MSLTIRTLTWNTSTYWNGSSAIVQIGHDACESDTGKFKRGDGTSTYSQLEYVDAYSLLDPTPAGTGSYMDIY